MNFPSRARVESMKKRYQEGMRVELIRMEDCQAPPVGTKGMVKGVDDLGSIMVDWDNGSSLSVVLGEDLCRVVRDNE